VYGSAHKPYLKILEHVANQALRICFGAYHTSPVSGVERAIQPTNQPTTLVSLVNEWMFICLIEHTDPQKCTNCNQLLSVKHILTECTLYGQTRH